ncbi:hypothetical protein ACVVIH_07550 [Chryseobacterium arthrosphaerae]|uniref:hypothetical protein n=1 Tax=Chryseobacterium arthrosphaerae TaxID=651561 RepID=UPI003D33DE54
MLIIGNYIRNLECKSFLDIETNRVRIRPSNNQGIPGDLVVECSREYRHTTKFPLGTKFIAEDVKVYKKTIGRIYPLRTNY